MDVNELKRHDNSEIPDLYINTYNQNKDLSSLEYDDDPVYTRMEAEGKIPVINVYNNIGGLRPYLPEENFDTNTKRFNYEISQHNKDKDKKSEFYKKIYKDNLHERDYLNLQNKADHIKKIDMALNFEMKPTTYTDTFEYTDKKKFRTENPDTEYHSKKSFMKTYTEFKIKQGHIMRK